MGTIPEGVKMASPRCGTCGCVAPHWIAAGQDVCTNDECPTDCEHYVPVFDGDDPKPIAASVGAT